MRKVFYIAGILTLVLLQSCGDKYKLKLKSPKTIPVNKTLSFSVSEKNGLPLDSVAYFLDGKRVDNPDSVDISGYRLGQHAVAATVYFEGKERKLTNTIFFMADHPPVIYTYEIVNEYPHDPKAFTQGFEFYKGFIYESTGQYGRSSLRKVELETGKVLKKIDIPKEYFAEGMTIFNNKIYQLTWLKKKGFIYDLETFEKIREFDYNLSKEGWGLTHNEKKLIKTDGTDKIWFLDPETLKEEYFIETYTDKRKAEKLNELEYINGQIYANIWQQNSILIVNPENGAIEGIINLKGLQEKAGQSGEDNVLNGIAYDQENDRLFVTGKDWNKVFEIKVIKK